MIKIEIEKLFGRFDYSIALNSNGLTIITGPNGYGKSTILKIIQNLSGRVIGFSKIMKIDFRLLKISFAKQTFVIEKIDKEIRINDVEVKKRDLEEFCLRVIENNRYLYQIDENHYMDRRTDEVYEITEYINKYLDSIESNNYLKEEFILNRSKKYSNLKVFDEIKECIGNVFFVQEQRLIKTDYSRRFRDERGIINVIEELPLKMKKLLTDFSTLYSKTAADLDSSYPSRLFKNEISITENEYEKERDIFKTKVARLSKYNLSKVSLIDATFKNEFSKALKIYFDDFNKKYSVYEPLIDKLDLFTHIVNSRLSYKSIIISNEKGLVVLDDGGKVLDINQLSSGEKQEIVLFYDLIFETPDNTLLLIDEPEISLHIVWQKMFIDDLLKIVNMKNLNVIVATHAPQIINGHWENTIDLGVLYEQHKGPND